MTTLLSLAAVFHVLGFLSAVNAVMTVRTSQGAIAWAVFLVSVPYLGVPAYWVLGRSRFKGYAAARRDSDGALADVLARARTAAEPFVRRPTEEEGSRVASPVRSVTGLPYLGGNDMTLLVDGHATFESIFEGIDRATEYVLVQFFIVKDDRIGRALKERLIAKAAAGVPVHFLYDEIGSYALPRTYVSELREAGVSVRPFHSRKGRGNRFQINFRNHRKLVVVDGQEAWIGGHNVGDEYLGRDPDIGPWRDTHVHLRGPTVLEAQLAFVEDWHWATDEVLELAWSPRASEEADLPVVVVPTGPADHFETAALLFAAAIHGARERIWIASPYFVPDEGVMQALLLAGLRGVDVRILIPDQPDHIGAWLAAFTFQAQAAGSGIRFYRYEKGFMHQKVVLQDDHLAAVGTANFDNRSFRLNFEISAVVADEGFAAEVAAMLEEDLRHSRPMPPNALSERPFWFRLAAQVARLSAPIQ